MQAIGIASAKIEGRMKRPEYVAAAVRACVEQRDFGFITDQTAAQLRDVFSRTGFTDGYYTGKRGAGMFGTRTRDDVVSADEKLLAQIRQGYKDEYSHISLSGSFSAKIGERAALTLTDGAHTVAVFSECKAEPAQKVALTAEKCRFQLGKTGGTAYLLDAVSINIEEALSLPLAALNTMRREALEQMNRLRANRHHYQINNITIQAPEPYRPSARTTRVRIPKTKIGKGFRACEIVFVPLFSDTREWERLQQEGYPLGVEIPRGMFGREEQIERQLRRAKEAGVTHALCQNIGAVYVAKQLGFVLHGGFGLTVKVKGDLYVDEHHTVEDTGIVLGQAFARALSDKGGIDRFGSFYVPMDEALAFASVDVSGRPFLVFDADFPQARCGGYDCAMTVEFMRALAFNAGITLHLRSLYGDNSHHITEALYKAAAHALRLAVRQNGSGKPLSTKGVL